MPRTFAPKTELELAEVIAGQGPFHVLGSGTKQMLGRPMVDAVPLSMKRFSGVDIYEPQELILEAGAATPLAEIKKLLAKRHQMLAFEPPDFSKRLGILGPGTLGGVLASGLAGPRRIKAGSVRDHVLGVRGVSGRGEIFKGGARVVKNVTGYDLPKLMAGSWGTLAALTSITFKVLPQPETETTIVIAGLSDQEAIAAMSAALQSPYEVSAAAHVPGQGTLIRLEGIQVSVRARSDALMKLLPHRCDALASKESRRQWQRIRDVEAVAWNKDDLIWRISVPPSDGADYMKRVSAHLSCKHFFDWGGGLIWLSVPRAANAHDNVVRGALKEGHAMLFRAPEDVRRAVPVFQPQPPALSALSARVKAAFDPLGKLNPSRMVEGR